MKRRTKHKMYRDGVSVPPGANLDAFNAGYYLGMKIAQNDSEETIFSLVNTFRCGIVNAVLKRYNFNYQRTSKMLKIKAQTVKKYEKG